jgi:EpsI family protein
MNGRALVVALIVLAAGIGRWSVSAVEMPATGSLESVPLQIGEWTGTPAPDLSVAVLGVLGADQYINRVYRVGGRAAVAGLYVGYHSSQKQGSAIHSPLNCLPGAGWQPIETGRRPFADGGTVNQVVIQKGEDRQVVLYWYQTATRIEGSEYWNKFHMLLDALSSHRNDAALVRVIVPIDSHQDDGKHTAAELAYSFAQLIEPPVKQILFH